MPLLTHMLPGTGKTKVKLFGVLIFKRCSEGKLTSSGETALSYIAGAGKNAVSQRGGKMS